MSLTSVMKFAADVVRPFIFGGGLLAMMPGCGGASEDRKGDITPWIPREGGVADTPTNGFFSHFDPKKSFDLKFEGRGKDGTVKLCSVYSAKGLPVRVESLDGRTTFNTYARWISFPLGPDGFKASRAYDEVATMPVKGTIYPSDVGFILGGMSVVLADGGTTPPLILLLHSLQSDGKCLATYDSGKKEITGVQGFTLDPFRFDPRELRIEGNGKPVVVCSGGRCPWIAPTPTDPPDSLWISFIQKTLEPGTRPDAGPSDSGSADSGVSDTADAGG